MNNLKYMHRIDLKFVVLDLHWNSIHEEIRWTLKAGNSFNYSVKLLVSSRILSKNLKIRIHETIILPVVKHGFLH